MPFSLAFSAPAFSAAAKRLAVLSAAVFLAVGAALAVGTKAEAAAQTLAEALAEAEGDAAPTIGSASGLALPRFVALKSAKVNMRIGPDQHKYPISWVYHAQGMPVEIIQEYDNWRRIRDVDGALGWVNAALLSGKRGAIIAPRSTRALLPLYSRADSQSAVAMKVEPGVVGAVKNCSGTWCELEIDRNRGYIQQNLLWGVYQHEVIK